MFFSMLSIISYFISRQLKPEGVHRKTLEGRIHQSLTELCMHRGPEFLINKSVSLKRVICYLLLEGPSAKSDLFEEPIIATP